VWGGAGLTEESKRFFIKKNQNYKKEPKSFYPVGFALARAGETNE
jgi:hypothetical protein